MNNIPCKNTVAEEINNKNIINSENLSIFGERLSQLLHKYNMNNSEFSDYVGISRTSLTGYMKGYSSPTIEPLIKISQKCNVSIDWLTGNITTRNLYTSDIITLLAESDFLKKLDAEKNDEESNAEYTFTITTKGEQATHVYDFIQEWKKVQDSLQTINDDALRDRFYQLWLKDQLE